MLRVLLLGTYQLGWHVTHTGVVVLEGLVGCRHPSQVADGLSVTIMLLLPILNRDMCEGSRPNLFNWALPSCCLSKATE